MGSKLIRPARLKSGSRIGLVAPAGPLREPDDIPRAEEQCRALGYEPVTGRHAAGAHGYLSGTDAERLADLNEALGDPSLDGVWCLRGGYGTPRLLSGVDYRAIAAAPKVLLGFSDITALLLAVRHATELVVFHGPIAKKPLTPFSREALLSVIASDEPAGRLPEPVGEGTDTPITTLRSGCAEGPLLGGNLSLLCHLLGTPYFPDPTGAILFVEDVGEELYAIDRCLAHLRLAGVLERVAGVAVGRFTETKGDPTGSLGLEQVLEDHLGPLGVPVVHGIPVGHVDDQWTLPVGVAARLDADAGTLELLDAAVS